MEYTHNAKEPQMATVKRSSIKAAVFIITALLFICLVPNGQIRAAAAADPALLVMPDITDQADEGVAALKRQIASLEKIILLNVPRAEKIPVLLYHHLVKEDEMTAEQRINDSVMSVEQFTEQMKFLFDNNYYTASVYELEQYLNGKKILPERTVVITFDDGYRSNTKYAYPLLKKYDFQASIFLITGLIGERDNVIEHAGWNDLRKCGDVFSYHSHSHSLHKLVKGGKSSFSLSESSEITNDLLISKALLSTSYLAYPYGQSSRAGKIAMSNSGYRLAFSTVAAYTKRSTDKLEIPRFSISTNTDIHAFGVICSGKADASSQAALAQEAS